MNAVDRGCFESSTRRSIRLLQISSARSPTDGIGRGCRPHGATETRRLAFVTTTERTLTNDGHGANYTYTIYPDIHVLRTVYNHLVFKSDI